MAVERFSEKIRKEVRDLEDTIESLRGRVADLEIANKSLNKMCNRKEDLIMDLVKQIQSLRRIVEGGKQ